MMTIQPVRLIGSIVRLEPLSEAHVPDLAIAGQDESIWQFLPYGNINTEVKMSEHVKMLLAREARGADLPFVAVLLESNKPIGCSRYLEIREDHRALEIGGTWYGRAYQRSGVNTECKYLLLKHAFETLGCIRVQFKTDARNQRSQKSLERIGAVKEGTLRKQMITADGQVRDSIYYSIIESEWPSVKANLEEKLERSYE
ncbi:MAG: N-acetyltransferase [Anaerolineales bacterium]|nr:MAG: N-acetyltransferase [Anaerolineales bacterium]